MNRACYLLIVSAWAAVTTLASAVELAATANPYATVVSRNIFGLVPIPTNPPVEAAPPEPPVKITLNGIMSIFGKVQALYKTPGKAKAGQPPKEESYVMSVGDRQDEIEVVAIDEAAGKVKFINHGIPQELTLVAAANVPSPVGAPPAGGSPGAPAGAVGAIPMPPGGNNAAGGARFGRAARGKNVTTSEDLAAATNPGLGGGGGVGGAGTANSAAASINLSPEAQVILVEAQREKFKSEGNPIAEIIPPSPLTSSSGNTPTPFPALPGN